MLAAKGLVKSLPKTDTRVSPQRRQGMAWSYPIARPEAGQGRSASYKATGNLRAVQILLGHTKIAV